MSKIWSGEEIDTAEPIAGWGSFGSVGQSGRGFRTLYSDEQGSRAWNVTQPGQTTHAPGTLADIDPIEQAAQEAFVQGFQEGERVTRETMAQDDLARTQLATAIALMAGAGEGTLATMISQAVIRLVGQIIGEVPIDAEVLTARCQAVAACIDSDDAKTVLEVNPEDLPLLETERIGVTLAANADLARGSVRLATTDGWVEDGPDVRLARLKDLMDDMEAQL